jgi:hypothetical protein
MVKYTLKSKISLCLNPVNFTGKIYTGFDQQRLHLNIFTACQILAQVLYVAEKFIPRRDTLLHVYCTEYV